MDNPWDFDCYCDYDQPSIYNKRVVTAKKQHKCSECGSVINAGERYENVFGVWDYADTFKTCQCCIELRDYAKAHVPCLCWAHGNANQDILDTVMDYASEAPGLLFGAYRRLVKIRVRRNSFKPNPSPIVAET